MAHNSCLLTPLRDENTKEQSASLKVPSQGPGSGVLRYTELPAHLPLHDSTLGEN